ncbi:MarR family transcriptional regulator [Paraburkholderia sp. GAS42]|uniref:MarR family transcriptional regulator n=1 Tax=Paraburkholderia sp. GAS42 TaxID=3035135 RepID=UPI003D1B8705
MLGTGGEARSRAWGARLCACFAHKLCERLPTGETMIRKISRSKGKAVASAILDMDSQWAVHFGDIGLNDLNYSDLFCGMWMDDQRHFAKTVLYDFMPGVSRRTAVRYVQALIDDGWLVEESAEHDRRVKYVSFGPSIEHRLEQFLAYVHERFGALG